MREFKLPRLTVSTQWIVFASLAVLSFKSNAQTVDATTVLGIIKGAMSPAINTLTAKAIGWVGAFATLQFVITNYNLLKGDGDLQTIIAKTAAALTWVGVVIYLINNGPQFITGVGEQFFSLIGVSLPSPGSIIAYTITVSAISGALALVVGAIPLAGTTAGMFLIIITLAILCIGLYFAFKIFMLQLELGLIAMLSPLSFSFLGLSTLRDQGIAPFKALLSLGYRIILLTVIMSAFGQVSDVVSSSLKGIESDAIFSGAGKFISTILSALGAYVLLGYLVYKSDSIASTLASGSTSMGTGDVAQAAAAGAAIGAAVATGGGSLAGAGARAPQAMRDFMSSLKGGGDIRNASPVGNATMPSPASNPSTSMSLAGNGSSSAPTSMPSSGSEQAQSTPAGTDRQGTSADSPGQMGSGAGAPEASKASSGRIGPDVSGNQAETQQRWNPEREGTASNQGSGQSAGISGGQPDLADQVSRLVDSMSQLTAPKKLSVRDRVGEANRHLERESAPVHVSISPHHHD